jgi:hypothetical protein
MDRIGPFQFFRLSRPPERISAQWEIARHSGIHGIALWNTGLAGEPFTVQSEAVALNFSVGRTFFANYKLLEIAAPVTVSFGIMEFDLLFKVLRVSQTEPGVKACPRVHVANDPTWYTALVFATWELIALDPFVQQP